MNKFDELVNKVESIKEDADKFYNKSNKAAGTRLRLGLQEIKVLAQAARSEVTELKQKGGDDYKYLF